MSVYIPQSTFPVTVFSEHSGGDSEYREHEASRTHPGRYASEPSLMVGSVTLIGWPEVDMDFWWRGRAEAPAEAAVEPADDKLLADISVRLDIKEKVQSLKPKKEISWVSTD